MKNDKIIHVTNTETQHGYKGNTGRVASLLATGMFTSQVITEAFEKHGLEEKQVKTALSNLKNRTDLFVYISEQDYIDLVNSTMGTTISEQDGIVEPSNRKTITEQQTENLPQPKEPVNQKEVEDALVKKLNKAHNELTTAYILYTKEYRVGSTSSKIIKHVKNGMSKGEIILACLADKESGLTEKQVKAYLANAVNKVKNITFK